MPKGKFVTSMLNFFGRKSREESAGDESTKPAATKRSGNPKRDRRAMLDADSFVFLPGERVDLYWGAVLNDQNFPVSDLAADYNSSRPAMGRRVTVSSHLSRSDESGTQNVRVLRPRAKTNEFKPDEFPQNSLLVCEDSISRRLSGSLVRSRIKSTDEVEDGSVLVDYGLCISERERWSQDLSGNDIYDRLIYPFQVSNYSKHPSTPDNDNAQRRDTHSHKHHSFVQSPPAIATSPPLNQWPARSFKDKDVSRRESERSYGLKADSIASHSYFDLESMELGSEYDLPWETVNWKQLKWRAQGVCLVPKFERCLV